MCAASTTAPTTSAAVTTTTTAATTSVTAPETRTSAQPSSTSAASSAQTTAAATTSRATSAAATRTPTTSVSLLVSSVTSNGQVVPVTLTQTVVVDSPSATSDAQSGGSSSTSSNGALIGGVVGGVVGGLLLVAAAIALFVILRRRKDRTGSAYFLCFGRRPKYGEKGELDHSAGNWPTFDPSSNAYAGAGAAPRSGRRAGGLPEATLPMVYADVDDLEDRGDPSQHHTSHDVTSRDGFSEQGRNSMWADGYSSAHAAGTDTAAGRSPNWPSAAMAYAPDYSHLDDPATRLQRQEGDASGMAPAAYPAYSGSERWSGARPQSADSNTFVDQGNGSTKGQHARQSSSSPKTVDEEPEPVPRIGAGQPLHLANPDY